MAASHDPASVTPGVKESQTPGVFPAGPVVITGGRGFVGRHLVRELQQHAPATRVVVWDLPAVDITKPETYTAQLAALQPDWVVHLAAVAAVGESLRDPAAAERVNTGATAQLLRTLTRDSPATKVLAVSSADIYGLPEHEGVPYDLATPLPELPLADARPRNPYAQSKFAMEQVIEAAFNDRCIRVRPFPHIGPGQRLGFVAADFASQIATIERHAPRAVPAVALREGWEASQDTRRSGVLRVGNLAAERDFTDVRDVVRAYRLLLEQGQLGEVYHVASGRPVQIQSLLDQLLALSTAKITVQVDAERLRPLDVPRLVGDAGKLTRLTGWQPTITLAQSLADVLADWRQRGERGR